MRVRILLPSAGGRIDVPHPGVSRLLHPREWSRGEWSKNGSNSIKRGREPPQSYQGRVAFSTRYTIDWYCTPLCTERPISQVRLVEYPPSHS